MSTRTSAAILAQAVKELSLEWQQARGSWNDVKSRQFEREYLEALPQHVARSIAVIEELDGLLGKVRKDCE